jgi:DNA-binding NarL/FixJ family response regulator
MKVALRTLIIEDEAPARMLLQRFLSDHEAIDIIGEFSDGFSGLKGIQENKPDLVKTCLKSFLPQPTTNMPSKLSK